MKTLLFILAIIVLASCSKSEKVVILSGNYTYYTNTFKVKKLSDSTVIFIKEPDNFSVGDTIMHKF